MQGPHRVICKPKRLRISAIWILWTLPLAIRIPQFTDKFASPNRDTTASILGLSLRWDALVHGFDIYRARNNCIQVEIPCSPMCETTFVKIGHKRLLSQSKRQFLKACHWLEYLSSSVISVRNCWVDKSIKSFRNLIWNGSPKITSHCSQSSSMLHRCN